MGIGARALHSEWRISHVLAVPFVCVPYGRRSNRIKRTAGAGVGASPDGG